MSPSGPVIIIPVKALALAKQRLAPVLAAHARHALAAAMLRDVLETINAWGKAARIIVASTDAEVAAIAAASGAAIHDRDAAAGLNQAVDAAMAALAPRQQAIVLPSDLPCLQPAELELLSQAGLAVGSFAIAPDRNDAGTNAVCTMPGNRVPALYGPGSFARHLSAATALALHTRIVRAPGLGLDIDTPSDLAASRALDLGPCTRGVLNRLSPKLTGRAVAGPHGFEQTEAAPR